MRIASKLAPAVLVSLCAAWTASAFADPPAHAPAHGWRKKHDPHYIGYTGVQWERDFDIRSGHCNRQEIATVVGGVVGGAIAHRVADENRAVATLIGAAAGAFIGNRIGHRLDEADRSCFGHALEVGEMGRPVMWTNETTGVQYEMTPGAAREGDGACREFTLTAVSGRDRSSNRGVACQAQPGQWQVIN